MHGSTYGIDTPVEKTTVYLPRDLKRALARLAHDRGCSEAALVREAVSQLMREGEAPAPRLPLFRAAGPSITADADRALEGFGSDDRARYGLA